jgi:hypothetical protein
VFHKSSPLPFAWPLACGGCSIVSAGAGIEGDFGGHAEFLFWSAFEVLARLSRPQVFRGYLLVHTISLGLPPLEGMVREGPYSGFEDRTPPGALLRPSLWRLNQLNEPFSREIVRDARIRGDPHGVTPLASAGITNVAILDQAFYGRPDWRFRQSGHQSSLACGRLQFWHFIAVALSLCAQPSLLIPFPCLDLLAGFAAVGTRSSTSSAALTCARPGRAIRPGVGGEGSVISPSIWADAGAGRPCGPETSPFASAGSILRTGDAAPNLPNFHCLRLVSRLARLSSARFLSL